MTRLDKVVDWFQRKLDSENVYEHDMALLIILGGSMFTFLIGTYGFLALGAFLLSLGGLWQIAGWAAVALSVLFFAALMYFFWQRIKVDFIKPIKRWFQQRQSNG